MLLKWIFPRSKKRAGPGIIRPADYYPGALGQYSGAKVLVVDEMAVSGSTLKISEPIHGNKNPAQVKYANALQTALVPV